MSKKQKRGNVIVPNPNIILPFGLGFWAVQYISEFTDINTCLNIVSLCCWTRDKLKIKYIRELKKNLNDAILQQKRYLNLIVLNLNRNYKISKIAHLIHLKELDISGLCCGVNDDQLQNLNLIKLDAHDNPKIRKIGHMNQLKELNIGYRCGVDDNQLQNLNLTILNA